MKYTPRLPGTNDNAPGESMLRELATLLLGVTAVIVVIYMALGFSVDLVAQNLSPEMEMRVARLLAKAIPETEATGESRYLQGIVDRMDVSCGGLPYPVTIGILENDAVNAVALAGGRILVFRGLLDTVESENELAFVIGHEIGHFRNRDHLRALGRVLVVAALSSLVLGPDSRMDDVFGRVSGMLELGFSRSQETAADRVGVELIGCLYGHAGGATDFFHKMMNDKDASRFGSYFSSHPDAESRIRDILSHAASLGLGMREPLPLH